MKRFVQILAIVGTGVVIGSVAGKYLKTEQKQLGKFIKDLFGEESSVQKPKVVETHDELELYFI